MSRCRENGSPLVMFLSYDSFSRQGRRLQNSPSPLLKDRFIDLRSLISSTSLELCL